MMLGEQHRHNPTIQIPSWPLNEEDDIGTHHISPTGYPSEYSPLYLQEALKALQRYLPSAASDDGNIIDDNHPDSPVDAYSCDQFRMYEFKVRRCARGRSHDWTECPFAHPGEKARRRDPRRYHYSGTACPEFRKGSCKKGDACEYAHGVFECWLHPARYRTQPCKDSVNCRRRVCFFAHTSDQLRVLSGNQGSPTKSSSPSESPPVSPMMNRSYNDVVSSLMNMQLGKANSFTSSWNGGSAYGSPRGSGQTGYLSLPGTPGQGRGGFWDRLCFEAEEETMERVESGRDIRKRMFEKLGKENSLERPYTESGPDVEWVSELLN